MDEEIYMLIDRYLAGELTTEERKAFEVRIKNEADFAEKVRIYGSLSENLRSRFSREEEETQLRETLSSISKTEVAPEKPARVISLQWYHWAAAASIALLAAVWFYTDTATLPEYSQYAFHGSLSITERGEDSLMRTTEEAFNSGRYEDAILYLNRLLEADPDNTELQLYKAISLLELDRIDEAEALFNVIRNSNTVYKDKAIWYLALSALKQKDYDKCKVLLEQIAEDSEDYGKAREILEGL